MRRTTKILVLLTAGLAAPLASAQNARPSIAIMRFTDRGSHGLAPEDLAALQIGLQDLLITELRANPNLQVLDRSRVDEGDAGARLSGLRHIDASAAAQVAARSGAAYVILGAFADLHGDFRMDVTIVNAVTAEVVTSARILQRRDSLYPMVLELAAQIAGGLNVPRPSRQSVAERRGRAIPEPAFRSYAKGLLYRDRGDAERARAHFREAIRLFPDFEEADRALKRPDRD